MTATLRELEKRLEREPENLSLRVTIAGHLRDAGRKAEAVELYRSVAVAYRGQGRTQQAIAVCRSILELAPDDMACHSLLADLVAPSRAALDPELERSTVTAAGSQVEPTRRRRPTTATGVAKTEPPTIAERDIVRPTPSFDSTTPLPRPLPYHVHDPTASVDRIPRTDVDLPIAEGADTRPGAEERTSDTTGLAEAARQISGLIARDTLPLSRGSIVRLSANDLESVTRDPSVEVADAADFDEAPTPVPTRARTAPIARAPTAAAARDTDEELTAPRELVAPAPIENAFFAALPAAKRAAALQRCRERVLVAGEVAIRQGESSHPLILVVSGRLEVRVERAAGASLVLEVLEAGQYVGEAALLQRAAAAAAVVAAVPAVVLALPPHVLFELAGAYPALWAALKDAAERRGRLYDRIIRASP